MPDITAAIDARIRAFVTELNTLVRQAALEAVGGALGGSPKRGPGRPKKVTTAPAARARGPGAKLKLGAKRDPALLARTVENLLKHITAHPGERIEQIGKHMGVSTKDLALPTQKLLAAKRITRRGAKRATAYYPAKKS